MITNIAARRYLRAIKREIPYLGSSRTKILNTIRDMIGEFLFENPEASYSQIESRFGTPTQIVSTYLEEAETSELTKALNLKKRVITVIIILAVSIFAVWVGVVSSALMRYYINNDGFVIEEITDITTVPYQEVN